MTKQRYALADTIMCLGILLTEQILKKTEVPNVYLVEELMEQLAVLAQETVPLSQLVLELNLVLLLLLQQPVLHQKLKMTVH